MKLPATIKPPVSKTCVYIHTRLDGIVFYVGIGSPRRPFSEEHRNQHWHSTTSKYAYSVSTLHSGLSWEAACAIEIDLIAKYRAISGDKLCNKSTGGDGGATGHKHSDETKAKMVSSRTGQVRSEAAKANMRAAQQNISDETRAKISLANKGRVRSVETRSKMSAARRNISDETRAKMSAAQKARPPVSEETREKLRLASSTMSAETKSKISAGMMGRVFSEETRAKLRAAKQNMSAETRAKIGDASRKRHAKKEHYEVA